MHVCKATIQDYKKKIKNPELFEVFEKSFCEETIRFDAGKAEICVIKVRGSPCGGKVNFKWPPFLWCQHSSGNFCRPW
jgi:hypothetical protein